MYTNIDYISNKIAYIRDFYSFNKNKLNIIILTEINAKNFKYPIIDIELNIPGYNMFHKNLSIKGYRGLALYIENKYDCMEIEVDKFDEYILLCITEINRSPQSSSDNDIALINLMNNICKRYNDSIIFIGDFNLPKLKWNNLLYDEDNKTNYNDLFIANLNDNFLSQHVLEPTRIRSDQT